MKKQKMENLVLLEIFFLLHFKVIFSQVNEVFSLKYIKINNYYN